MPGVSGCGKHFCSTFKVHRHLCMYCILALLSSALANTPPHPALAHQHMKAFQLAPNACTWQVARNMRIKPIWPQLPFLKYQWSPALHQGLVRGKHVNGTKSSSWHSSTQLFCSLLLEEQSFHKVLHTNGIEPEQSFDLSIGWLKIISCY